MEESERTKEKLNELQQKLALVEKELQDASKIKIQNDDSEGLR